MPENIFTNVLWVFFLFLSWTIFALPPQVGDKQLQTEAERVAWDAAAAKYPLYQEGEVVTIDFAIGRGPIKTYHGEYHTVGLTRIQIGSTTLFKKDLPETLQARFDAKLNESLRDKEVKRLLSVGDKVNTREIEKSVVVSSPLGGADDIASKAHEKCITVRETTDRVYSKTKELQTERIAGVTIANANRKRQEGRGAYLAGDFQGAMELYQTAYLLYQQALTEGMDKLEQDWKDALASGQWRTAREIAEWMVQYNSLRGQQMLRTTAQTESDTYFACGEEALMRLDWPTVRKFADLLWPLDEKRAEDLRTRAYRGEMEELPDKVNLAIANCDWSQAREMSHRLTEFEQDNGEILLSKIDAAESDWLYRNGEDAMEDGDWRTARSNALRLKEIEGDTVRGLEMLSKATQMGVDELVVAAGVAQEQGDWGELDKVANKLSNLSAAEAQPVLAELRQHNGGIEIGINVSGVKSAKVTLYVGDSSSLDSLFKNWCYCLYSLAVAQNMVVSARNREASVYFGGNYYYWYIDPRPLKSKKYEAKRNATAARNELARAATAFSSALGKAYAVYSFDFYESKFFLPNVDRGDYFLLVKASDGGRTLIWGEKVIVEYDQTSQIIFDIYSKECIIDE